MINTPLSQREFGKVKAHYSLLWAAGVVKSFTECYPRGVNFLEKALDLDGTILAKVIADGRDEWSDLRKMAKSWQSWTEKSFMLYSADPEEYFRTHVNDFLLVWTNKVSGNLAAYLTTKNFDRE